MERGFGAGHPREVEEAGEVRVAEDEEVGVGADGVAFLVLLGRCWMVLGCLHEVDSGVVGQFDVIPDLSVVTIAIRFLFLISLILDCDHSWST